MATSSMRGRAQASQCTQHHSALSTSRARATQGWRRSHRYRCTAAMALHRCHRRRHRRHRHLHRRPATLRQLGGTFSSQAAAAPRRSPPQPSARLLLPPSGSPHFRGPTAPYRCILGLASIVRHTASLRTTCTCTSATRAVRARAVHLITAFATLRHPHRPLHHRSCL